MLVRLGFDDIKVVLRDTGSLLKWSSLLFIAPILAGLWFREETFFLTVYALTGILAFFTGITLKGLFRTETETDLKHAFMITALIWIFFTALSALPFNLITGMAFLDSFFEAMSAITTTGLTIMENFVDSAPKSLIFWRSFISWIGGIGIIVLSLVGVFATYTKASRLMVAEGRQEMIRPNLRNTAKEIWIVYAVLTVFGMLLLFFAGMDAFDSVNYSMSAISNTGMATTTQGLVGIGNVWVSMALVLIMIIGATSFALHHLLLRRGEWKGYIQNSEFKVLITLLIISVALVLPKFLAFYPDAAFALESAIFHNTSSLTCGGFAISPISDIKEWDDFVILVMLGLMVIGGSSGSTSGGIKVSRAIIFAKSVYWRIKELILPKESYFRKTFEGQPIENRQLREVNQFILIYLLLIIAGVFVLTFNGLELKEAMFTVFSAQGNVGIETGAVNEFLPAASKIMLILSMWIGRLEIIPLLSAIGFALSFKRG